MQFVDPGYDIRLATAMTPYSAFSIRPGTAISATKAVLGSVLCVLYVMRD